MSYRIGPAGSPDANVPGEMLERGRLLILAAFDEARATRRVNWVQMTTAVLKNRLLNSTHREFSEADYGASSMVDFVRLFPDDLTVDTQQRPPVVQLIRPEILPDLNTEEDEDGTDRPALNRIRPDLWRAIVDFSNDTAYVWDEVVSRARPAIPDDVSPVMPTITSADVTAWRQNFTDSIRPGLSSTEIIERLDEWSRRGYGTGFLPTGLRGQWSGFFRNKIEQRLRAFFTDQGIPVPDDLVVEATQQSPELAQSRQHGGQAGVEQLRSLVQHCVAVMSEQELTDLRISPAVLLWVQRGRA